MKYQPMRASFLSTVLGLLAMLAFAAGSLFGQAASSSVSGTILDQMMAAIPGADVVISNPSKGIERKLQTNGAGIFTAPDLLPSDGYTLTVTKPGFSKNEVKNFKLQIGQAVELNLVLSVAAVGTEVEVTSEAPLVEGTKTDVSSVVDSGQILNLPINGRRVDSFVLLTPGTTNDGTFGLLTFRGNPGGNTFMTDGIDTTNSFYDENAGRTRSYNISQDAVQEFQVVTSNFLPEYGRASGGVVNTITKSGSNDIHGTLYWFFRNRTLSATDPTANGINPPEWRHQAGASIGGPIKKNKLFYFFNGELERRSDPILSSNISSTLFDANGNPTGAINPVTGCGGTSFTVKASAAQCQTAINYLLTRVRPQLVPRKVDDNLLFGKIDYQINDRNRLTAEMNYVDFRSPNGIQTQGVLTNGSAIGNNADTNVFDRTEKLGLTTIVTPNSVNELRFGIFKDRQYDPASPTLFPAATGPSSYSISTGSLSNIGVGTNYPRLHPSELRFQLSDTYAYTLGRHAMKFGVDWAHTEDYDKYRSNQFGTYVYGNINAFALDFSNPVNGKNWTTYSQKFGNPLWDGNTQDFALFAQDEIHLTPKWTISPGLRFEHTSLPQPSAPLPLGALNIPADFPQTGTLHYKASNIAPRIGVAYAMNNKTVFRAGYGMFYNRYITQIIDGLAEANGSYQPSYTLQSNVAAQLAAGPVFPSALSVVPNVTGSASLAFATNDFRNAYSEQLQASIQREIAKNTGLTVSYIWSRGLHMVTGYNANLGAPTASYTYAILNSANVASATQVGSYTTPIYTRSSLINPNYGTVMGVNSNANSWYNGMIVQVTHRYTSWFQGSANYTWSHSEDDNIGGAAGSFPINNGILFAPSQPPSYANNDFGNEKGSSATDQRHRLVITGIVEPKFTKGNSWWEKNIVNGWQLSFISTFASSFPITSTIGGVSSSTLPTIAGQTIFATSTINGLGGSTRVPFQPVDNLDVGPTYRTDARISHTFTVTERIKVALAFEAQNVFNHLIVSGAAPLNQQEYTLVKAAAGTPFAGQSVLVPFANYKQLLQTQTPPDGTTARRAQASLRITF
jgi:hypothetical protein